MKCCRSADYPSNRPWGQGYSIRVTTGAQLQIQPIMWPTIVLGVIDHGTAAAVIAWVLIVWLLYQTCFYSWPSMNTSQLRLEQILLHARGSCSRWTIRVSHPASTSKCTGWKRDKVDANDSCTFHDTCYRRGAPYVFIGSSLRELYTNSKLQTDF